MDILKTVQELAFEYSKNAREFLSQWYPKVEANFAGLKNWLDAHMSGSSGYRHTADDIDYDSSATVKAKIDAEVSARQNADNNIRELVIKHHKTSREGVRAEDNPDWSYDNYTEAGTYVFDHYTSRRHPDKPNEYERTEILQVTHDLGVKSNIIKQVLYAPAEAENDNIVPTQNNVKIRYGAMKQSNINWGRWVQSASAQDVIVALGRVVKTVNGKAPDGNGNVIVEAGAGGEDLNIECTAPETAKATVKSVDLDLADELQVNKLIATIEIDLTGGYIDSKLYGRFELGKYTVTLDIKSDTTSWFAYIELNPRTKDIALLVDSGEAWESGFDNESVQFVACEFVTECDLSDATSTNCEATISKINNYTPLSLLTYIRNRLDIAQNTADTAYTTATALDMTIQSMNTLLGTLSDELDAVNGVTS